MKNKIKEIKIKLEQLKKLDPKLKAFGASTHEYKLNPTLSEAEILVFEHTHHITLPPDYRLFLKEIGNGGAGPYYGLWTLEEGIYEYEGSKEFKTNLNQPFPHTASWNLDFNEVTEEEWDAHMEELEHTYYISKWGFGLLRLCHFGCAVYMGLVVNGTEHGHIWVDDRANHNGIYPDPYFDQKEEERTAFLDWYELWLDKNIKRMFWVDWIEKTILRELNNQKNGLQLREYLVQFKDADGRRGDAYSCMNEFRKQFEEEQKEQEENIILELMDYISGHCQKKYVVWSE